jgi:N-acetylmuramoyl-L-alanine amidase
MPKPARIKYLVVHCTDSPYGSVDMVREWHLSRQFHDIGYHFLILNGYTTSSKKKSYNKAIDGKVCQGRRESRRGAHARGYNTNSLGVCMVGREGNFSIAQLSSLKCLLVCLMREYNVPLKKVIGHYETKSGTEQGKTCPTIDMPEFRLQLEEAQHIVNSYERYVLRYPWTGPVPE